MKAKVLLRGLLFLALLPLIPLLAGVITAALVAGSAVYLACFAWRRGRAEASHSLPTTATTQELWSQLLAAYFQGHDERLPWLLEALVVRCRVEARTTGHPVPLGAITREDWADAHGLVLELNRRGLRLNSPRGRAGEVQARVFVAERSPRKTFNPLPHWQEFN